MPPLWSVQFSVDDNCQLFLRMTTAQMLFKLIQIKSWMVEHLLHPNQGGKKINQTPQVKISQSKLDVPTLKTLPQEGNTTVAEKLCREASVDK